MFDEFNYSRIFFHECCALATFNERNSTDVENPINRRRTPMHADKIKTQANDTHGKP